MAQICTVPDTVFLKSSLSDLKHSMEDWRSMEDGGWRQSYVKSWGLNLTPSLIFVRQIREAISLIITLRTSPYVSLLLDNQHKMAYFQI